MVSQKIAIILENDELKSALENISESPFELHSDQFHLMTGDLAKTESIKKCLEQCHIQADIPTMFISECVLIYLDPRDSDSLISWTSSTFKKAFFWTYEQINPNDPFGSRMVENLKLRGCSLNGIHAYPSLDSQVERYIRLGFPFANGETMFALDQQMFDLEERLRVSRVEIFDEVEEWRLIQEHYCIVLASSFQFSQNQNEQNQNEQDQKEQNQNEQNQKEQNQYEQNLYERDQKKQNKNEHKPNQNNNCNSSITNLIQSILIKK